MFTTRQRPELLLASHRSHLHHRTLGFKPLPRGARIQHFNLSGH